MIREERARGEPIFYGDATKDLILKHANIEEARCLVIVINDPLQRPGSRGSPASSTRAFT